MSNAPPFRWSEMHQYNMEHKFMKIHEKSRTWLGLENSRTWLGLGNSRTWLGLEKSHTWLGLENSCTWLP